MTCYNKTIEADDFLAFLPGIEYVTGVRLDLQDTHFQWGHEMRTWEYSLALTALMENKAQQVLDIGGGGSIFAACAIRSGMQVLQVDPDPRVGGWLDLQRVKLNMELPWAQADFMTFNPDVLADAVTCISVLEHVPDDLPFFNKLLSHVRFGGLLCLTTDFHLSGVSVFGGHDRTYNAGSLLKLISIAQAQGFEVYGDAPDYSHFEPAVFNLYTFGSMVLRKVE